MSLTIPNKSVAWYIKDENLPPLHESVQEFFTQYSSMPADQVQPHILHMVITKPPCPALSPKIPKCSAPHRAASDHPPQAPSSHLNQAANLSPSVDSVTAPGTYSLSRASASCASSISPSPSYPPTHRSSPASRPTRQPASLTSVAA